MDPEADQAAPQPDVEEQLGVSPTMAAMATFEGVPIVLSPLLGDVPHGLAKLVMSGKPIDAPFGTPLSRLAEFTKSEVNAIKNFAQQQGVTVPIVASGPGFESGYFIDQPGPIRQLLAKVMGEPVGDVVPHIGVSQGSLPHVFHEIGHASPIAGSDALRRTFQSLARTLGTGSTLGHILRAGIASSLLSQPDENTSGVQRFVHDNAPALVGATMIPELAEEARASINAVRGASRAGVGTMNMVRELAPAFGTYLASAAAPVIATVFAKKLIEALRGAAAHKQEEQEEQKTAATAGAEVKAPGALRTDAAAAWRVGGSPPKPKSIPPANASSGHPAKERAAAKPPSNNKFYKDMLDSLYNPQRGFRLATPPQS